MKNIYRFLQVLLILTFFQFWACENNNKNHSVEHPSEVEDIDGSDLATVTLTEKAIERIGLQTAMLTEMHSSPSILVVPYSSIIYDPQGQVWVYTNPQPLTFVRHKVEVDFIKGNMVFLKEGPPVGTLVVTVGAAEVYGAEFEIGH